MTSKQSQRQSISASSPEVIRGKFGKLTIYEITDYELELLGKGSHDSLYLNFAIFLISTAIAFLIALLTTNITSPNPYLFFLTVTIIGFLGSAFLFMLWFRNRRSISQVVETIQKRLQPEQMQIPGESTLLFQLSDGRILQITEETIPDEQLQNK